MLLIWLLLRASTHTGWAALSWWGNVLWLILIDLLFQPGSLSSDTHHIPELQVAVLCGPDVQTTWCIYIYIGQRISYDYTDTWTVLMQWKVQNCWKFSCHIEATSSVKDLPNQYCVLRWPSGTVPDFAIAKSRVRLPPVAAVYQRQLSVPSLRGRFG